MDQKVRNRIIAVIGLIVMIGFCLFAAVAWPKIAGKPEMVLNGDAEITVAVGSTFTDEGVTAKIRSEDVQDRVYVTGEVDTSAVGTYEITYSVDGRWQTYSVTRTVHVTDQTAPEITLSGDASVSVDQIEDYQEPGVSATDNCDGDLSAAVQSSMEQVNDYTYTITYRVSDQAGNEGTAEREVVIRDTAAPQITLNGDAEMEIEGREKFTDPGATAVDDRDGDVSASITASGYVDIYEEGTYTVTYTVADSAGNQAEATRKVKVKSAYTNPAHSIYLTFDDGPSKDVTAEVLDILAANNVKATFFICNYDESTLPLIKRMLAEGHTIGIHGYSHDYAKVYASTDAFMDSIHTLRDKLKADTGYEAFVIRFPGGSSNTVSKKYCPGIMTQLAQLVTDEGLMYTDWNVSSGDAASNHVSSSSIYSNVTSGLKADRGNIVLMHDTSAKQTTADALQNIITYGKNNGYQFYAFSEDTAPSHQGIQN